MYRTFIPPINRLVFIRFQRDTVVVGTSLASRTKTIYRARHSSPGHFADVRRFSHTSRRLKPPGVPTTVPNQCRNRGKGARLTNVHDRDVGNPRPTAICIRYPIGEERRPRPDNPISSGHENGRGQRLR